MCIISGAINSSIISNFNSLYGIRATYMAWKIPYFKIRSKTRLKSYCHRACRVLVEFVDFREISELLGVAVLNPFGSLLPATEWNVRVGWVKVLAVPVCQLKTIHLTDKCWIKWCPCFYCITPYYMFVFTHT